MCNSELLYGHFALKSFRLGWLAPYLRSRNIILEACLFWFLGEMTGNRSKNIFFQNWLLVNEVFGVCKLCLTYVW